MGTAIVVNNPKGVAQGSVVGQIVLIAVSYIRDRATSVSVVSALGLRFKCVFVGLSTVGRRVLSVYWGSFAYGVYIAKV